MDVYSERLSRLVGQIPPDMLPSLPDVVVECIRLHAVQPGAALRNRSEAAFLRWMCSQIEMLVFKKCRLKALERKSRKPQEKPLERKGVHKKHEQKFVTPPYVRHVLKEIRGDDINGSNRNASYNHRNLKPTVDLTGMDNFQKNFRVDGGPMETTEQVRGRKRDDERNGNDHRHLSLKEMKHSKIVRDTNEKNWKRIVSQLYDSRSEPEEFMDIDKTSGNHQILPEAKELRGKETRSNQNAFCNHWEPKETGDFIGMDNHRKPIPFPVGDSPTGLKEQIKEGKRVDEKDSNNHIHSCPMEPKKSSRTGDRNGKKWKRNASYMYDSQSETQGLSDKRSGYQTESSTRQKDTHDFTGLERTNKTKQKFLASHQHDNPLETKELIRESRNINDRNENNHAHLTLKETESKGVRDKNEKKWRRHASYAYDSQSDTQGLSDKRSGNQTEFSARPKDTLDFTGFESTNKSKQKFLTPQRHDNPSETMDPIRERKNINKRNENKSTRSSLKEMESKGVRDKNEKKWKWVTAHTRDSLSDTDDFMEVDKISANRRNPSEAYMCLEETVEVPEVENSNQRNQKILKFETHNSPIEPKESIETDKTHENSEETKEQTKFENANAVNYFESPAIDNFQESSDLKEAENINVKKHKPKPHLQNNHEKTRNLTVDAEGVERRDRKTQTHYSLTDLKEFLKCEITHEDDWNHIESYMHDSLREIMELIREQKEIGKRNRNRHVRKSSNETQDKHEKLNDAKDLIISDTEDVRKDPMHRTQREPASNQMHKSPKETADLPERAEIATSCTGDEGSDGKKQQVGSAKSHQLPQTSHSQENTLKRKRNKSPENVSTTWSPPTETEFTYLSVIDNVENGSPNSLCGWTRPSTVNNQEANDPSHPSADIKITKDRKQQGSHNHPKTEKMHLAHEKTTVKDQTRSNRKLGGSHQKRVQFGVEV